MLNKIIIISTAILMQGCASAVLSSNIREGECNYLSRPIPGDNKIFQQWDIERKYGGFLISKTVGNEKLYFEISPGSTVSISDVPPVDHKIRKAMGKINVLITTDPVDTLYLRDLYGNEPIIIWQYKIKNYLEYKRQTLGNLFVLSDSKIFQSEIYNDIKAKNMGYILNKSKNFGYIITVPFDVVTIPLQIPILIYGYLHSFPNVKG